MIPKAFIDEWRTTAPWHQDAYVEQDLVISRALVSMYSEAGISRRLAFRGGTALHKLFIQPGARYSEDIDLVQIRAEPIGDTLDRVRTVLDPWLGAPRRKLKEGRVNLIYRFGSEDIPALPMRLKVEINSREHFTELGHERILLEVGNRWFSGSAEITTYNLNELMGTKLRALYQRKKGRDVFDLWFALRDDRIDPDTLLRCFERYMAEGGHAVTRAQFEANLHEKARSVAFRDDVGLLLRPGVPWDLDEALELLHEKLVSRLPGNPWKGDG